MQNWISSSSTNCKRKLEEWPGIDCSSKSKPILICTYLSGTWVWFTSSQVKSSLSCLAISYISWLTTGINRFILMIIAVDRWVFNWWLLYYFSFRHFEKLWFFDILLLMFSLSQAFNFLLLDLYFRFTAKQNFLLILIWIRLVGIQMDPKKQRTKTF